MDEEGRLCVIGAPRWRGEQEEGTGCQGAKERVDRHAWYS